jgi:hypothetical protein
MPCLSLAQGLQGQGGGLMDFRQTYRGVLVLGLMLLTGACGLGRKADGAGLKRARLSEARSLCTINDNGTTYDPMGCYQLQLNLDDNFAYLDVLEMGEGWDASQSYRVLAFRAGEARPWVLKRNVTAGAGQTVEVDAYTGHNIWDYVEWVVEFEYGELGLPYDDGAGAARIAQDVFDWSEVFELLTDEERNLP